MAETRTPERTPAGGGGSEATRAVFKVHINGRIEDVWREITRTEGLNAAFFNMKMDVDRFAPGGKLRMRTADGKYTGVVGEIVECDPPRRLVHTFKFTQYDDPPCRMVYDLVETHEGVDFTLTAEDIPVGTKTAGQLGGGGKMIVKTLKDIVERGRPSFGTRFLYGVIKLTTPLTPKRCLSENWP